jgi:hypothetical protein
MRFGRAITYHAQLFDILCYFLRSPFSNTRIVPSEIGNKIYEFWARELLVSNVLLLTILPRSYLLL